jgi:hypothetical protein
MFLYFSLTYMYVHTCIVVHTIFFSLSLFMSQNGLANSDLVTFFHLLLYSRLDVYIYLSDIRWNEGRAVSTVQ